MICGRNIWALVCASVLLLCWSHRADARSLDEILARGAFSICADPDALPFSQRSGAPAGFQIDLAKILADRIGVRLDVDWIALRNAARGANCDAIIGSLAQAHDDEAEEHKPSAGVLRAALTRPYARQTTRIVIAEGSPRVQTLDDLRGRPVAAIHASLAHYFLNAKHIPVRTMYPTQEEILAAVARKEMSAGVVSDWIFGWYRKTHPESGLRIVDSSSSTRIWITTSPSRFGTPTSNSGKGERRFGRSQIGRQLDPTLRWVRHHLQSTEQSLSVLDADGTDADTI